MAELPPDRIHIQDLRVRCIIGINPEERHRKQDVIINVTLHADLRNACETDQIEDTVDYKAVKKEVLEAVESSKYLLIERLAGRVAEISLKSALVQRVDVRVDKPGALRFSDSVGVVIERKPDAFE